MTSRLKHMERSRRSHGKGLPERMFANKAQVKQNRIAAQQHTSIFQKLFHRRTNLSGNIVPREEDT